ncbi:hypothetical protein Bca4012_000438 [Brassica carinata]
MEKTEESVGIRVYTPQKPSPSPPSRSPKPLLISSLPSLPPGAAAGGGRGRKRRMVAQGVQKTVSKTSMIVNFLPTGTLLMFEMVLPSIYRDGDCNGINTLMIHILLLLCATSCFFFHFTDSFKAADEKIYYGFVTPRGLAVFMKPPPPEFGGGGDAFAEAEIPVTDERYKLKVNDFVHAVMSVLVFMAIAFSDRRVTRCLVPGKQKEMDQVMESFPLMVGIWSLTTSLKSSNNQVETVAIRNVRVNQSDHQLMVVILIFPLGREGFTHTTLALVTFAFSNQDYKPHPIFRSYFFRTNTYPLLSGMYKMGHTKSH